MFSILSALPSPEKKDRSSNPGYVPPTVARAEPVQASPQTGSFQTPIPSRTRYPQRGAGGGGGVGPAPGIHHKDRSRLHKSLSEVFSTLCQKANTYKFQPFHRDDGQSDFFEKYDKLRRAIAHSGDWSLGDGGSLKCVSGHPLTGTESQWFSSMAASLLISKAVEGRLQEDLITLTQNPTARGMGAHGSSLAAILEYIQRQTEGYHPIKSLLETMGADLRQATFTSPDEVYQWGQAVLERGAWVALSLGRSLRTHKAAIIHASLTEYSDPDERATQAPSEESLFQNKMRVWVSENPDRENYPRTVDEAHGYPPRNGATDEEYESIQVEHDAKMEGKYKDDLEGMLLTMRTLRAQYKSYMESVKKFRAEARAEVEKWKEAQRPAEKSQDQLGADDQLSRSQMADACRHFAGFGLTSWLKRDAQGAVLYPVSLSPRGWRKVFEECTPVGYRRMFSRYSFPDDVRSPNAWIREIEASVDMWLRGVGKKNRVVAQEKRKSKKKDKRASDGGNVPSGVKPVFDKSYQPSGSVGDKKQGFSTTGTSNRSLDPSIGCARHFVRDTDFSMYINQPTVTKKIVFLREHLNKEESQSRIPTATAKRYRDIYAKRLKALGQEGKAQIGKNTLPTTERKNVPIHTPLAGRTRAGRRRQQQFGVGGKSTHRASTSPTEEVSVVEEEKSNPQEFDHNRYSDLDHSDESGPAETGLLGSLSDYDYEDLDSRGGATDEDSYTEE